MTCVICKSGHYQDGFTTIVLTKKEAVVIIKQVPALLCDQCGDYILSSEISKQVLAIAERAYSQGSEVEIRRFVA